MNLTPSFVRHAFLPLNFVFLFSFFAIAEDRIDAKAALDLVGYPEEMAMGVAEIEGVADYLFLFDAWARDGWKKTFRRNFPVDGILREIEAKVAREVSSAHLAEIAVFYRTPLGARVLAAQRLGVESPAMTPDPAEAVSRLAEIEAAEPARLRLIDRLAAADRADDWAYDGVRQRAYIYIASLPAAGRGSFGRSRAEIDRDARARIEPRRNALRSALRVKLMRVFADLADADLREYVEFAESRASIAFNQSYMWSYSEAFESRMREFGDVMMLNTGAVFR